MHVKESSAYTPSDADNGDQQNPARIYSALYACLAKVPKNKLERVKRIAFSGQMHGVVYWKANAAWMVHPSEIKEVKYQPADVGIVQKQFKIWQVKSTLYKML